MIPDHPVVDVKQADKFQSIKSRFVSKAKS